MDAIKLDCKDTRSHIYAHINIFRLRGEGGEITQEKKDILNLGSTLESQIYTCVKDTHNLLENF